MNNAKKYKTTTIVINIIYNSNGHFVYFKDFRNEGNNAYYNNTGGITHETNYLSLWIHIKT